MSKHKDYERIRADVAQNYKGRIAALEIENQDLHAALRKEREDNRSLRASAKCEQYRYGMLAPLMEPLRDILKNTEDEIPRYTLTLIFDSTVSYVLMEFHKKQGALNYVGGHIAPEEEPMEASYRELLEKTGIGRDDVRLKFVESEDCTASFANPRWYLYVTTGILKHDVGLIEEKNPLRWIPTTDTDTILNGSFGDGNCLVFLRRALAALGLDARDPIRIGDEVVCDGIRGIAVKDEYPIGPDREPFATIWFGYRMSSCSVGNVKKTGRRFEEIQEILDQLHRG